MGSPATARLKLFGITSQLLEHDLDRIEREFAIDLGRGHQRQAQDDETYYPQIEQQFRAEAAAMAPHYEVFYSLERTIRAQVADQLEAAAQSEEWWDSKLVPDEIRKEVAKRRKREAEAAVTPRSQEAIDFTTFGELSEIIKVNWAEIFESTFSDLRAVQRVMAQLNTLRGPVAHCTPLAEDEILRLQLSVRDWFRLME
jgi:hypothetical protein